MYADIEVSEVVLVRNSADTGNSTEDMSVSIPGHWHGRCVRLCHQSLSLFDDALWKRHVGLEVLECPTTKQELPVSAREDSAVEVNEVESRE